MPDNPYPQEHLKNRSNTFGGFQYVRLASIEIERRYCATLGCGDRGKRQIPVPGGYRIVCGRHSAILLAMTLGVLGQPNAASEVREHAAMLRVDFDTLLASEPVHPAMPEWFRCLKCGGELADGGEDASLPGQTIYVHTCKGES